MIYPGDPYINCFIRWYNQLINRFQLSKKYFIKYALTFCLFFENLALVLWYLKTQKYFLSERKEFIRNFAARFFKKFPSSNQLLFCRKIVSEKSGVLARRNLLRRLQAFGRRKICHCSLSLSYSHLLSLTLTLSLSLSQAHTLSLFNTYLLSILLPFLCSFSKFYWR